MMMRMAYLVVLAVVTTVAWSQPGGGPALVRVERAVLEQMAANILVPGTVVSRLDARVSAEVGGVLTSVSEVGTEVSGGEVVAHIRNATLELREPELKAQVDREKARFQFLEREVERLERLAQQNNAARTQLDQTQSDRQVAFSDMNVAESRLAQVQDQLYRTRQKAPFGGIVVERFRRPGEMVDVGSEILRMVDPAALEVIARAPLEYLPFVRVGESIGMSVGGQLSTGQVRTIAAVGDENTHVFEIRADIVGNKYPVGLTVRLTLSASDTREVLAVPRDALVLRASGISVFVIDPDDTARRVDVRTGLASGNLIEVIGDLMPGERVVVRGNERLRQGQQVSIQESEDTTDGQVAGQ